MSGIQYGTLRDGTPVLGVYDVDGEPLLVKVEWHGMDILVDSEGLDTPFGGVLTFPEYGRLRELVTSGVVEELVIIHRRFLASGYGPVEPPRGWDTPELIELWHSRPRDSQLRIRPVSDALNGFVDILSPARAHALLAGMRDHLSGTLSPAELRAQSEALFLEELDEQFAAAPPAPSAAMRAALVG